jgi:hypothetical protein
MASVNQTRPHCVNQMGKTHSKPLAARHAMCESALRSMWLACDLQEKTDEASCHLLATATLCQFLLWYKMSLVATVEQMLKCQW